MAFVTLVDSVRVQPLRKDFSSVPPSIPDTCNGCVLIAVRIRASVGMIASINSALARLRPSKAASYSAMSTRSDCIRSLKAL
ncbi:hypothetical protein D3C81_1860260 [compost metagenome]